MKRNKFSLSNYKLFTCNMGELIPCGLQECLPGDTMQASSSILLRASPLLSPVMHPVDVRVHHFFTPMRLIWNSWENFITGGPDGLNASVFPTITIGGGSGAAVGSLADYLGVPTGVNNLAVSALPFRAYNLVWNEFFRDQDLQTPLVVSTADGADTTTCGVNSAGAQLAYTNGAALASNCAWEKDYLTSSRPWEQKGPAVTVPLSGQLPVKGIGAANNVAGSQNIAVTETGGTTPTYAVAQQASTGTNIYFNKPGTFPTPNNLNIYADLAGATGITVNQLRQALALQRMEEMRARYGSRYVEYLRSAFGVRSSDGRLARPEYCGGGRETIQWSEVLQTAPEGAATISNTVGAMKGHGIAAMRSNRFRRYFEEHGYLISFMSVRPKTVYASGLPRHFNRRLKEDFFQPELAHIGQQAVKNKEVYAAHASPDATFGYQDRYDEYRRTESSISGEYRSTLNFWHFARIFGSSPALNASFVSCVPTEVPFAVNTTHTMWVMAKHSIQARRPLPAVGKSYIF